MIAERKLHKESQAGKHVMTSKEAIDNYWLKIAMGESIEHPGGEDHILALAQGRKKRISSVTPSQIVP